MTLQCDILVVGATVTGLWIAQVLKRAGYNVWVVDNKKIFATEKTHNAICLAGLDTGLRDRWVAACEGWGDVDLTRVHDVTTDIFTPVKKPLWQRIFGRSCPSGIAPVLSLRDVYEGLVTSLKGFVVTGTVTDVMPHGGCRINGRDVQTQYIVYADGVANAAVYDMMRIRQKNVAMIDRVFVSAAYFDEPVAMGDSMTMTCHSYHEAGQGYAWIIAGHDMDARAAAGATDAELCAMAQSYVADFSSPSTALAKKWDVTRIKDAVKITDTGAWALAPYIDQRGRVLILYTGMHAYAPMAAGRVKTFLSACDAVPSARATPPPFLSLQWSDAPEI